jgi:hypothetical protein
MSGHGALIAFGCSVNNRCRVGDLGRLAWRWRQLELDAERPGGRGMRCLIDHPCIQRLGGLS